MVTHRVSRQSRDLSSMNAEMSGIVCWARQHASMSTQAEIETANYFKRDSVCTARKSDGANSLDFAQQ